MYLDFENAIISGKPVTDVITDRAYWRMTSLLQFKSVEQLLSKQEVKIFSQYSAASACIDHVKNFLHKTPEGQYFSAAVPSLDGSYYDVPAGSMYSVPSYSMVIFGHM